MAQLTIMLVEDPELDDGLSDKLTHAGHRVLQASTGAQAVASAAHMRLDLLIIDLDLPDTHGLLVIGEFAEAWVAPMLVTVRDHHPRGERTLALKLGADDVVDRPVDMPELKARIQSLLRAYANAAARHSGADPPSKLPQVVGDLRFWESRTAFTVFDSTLVLTPIEHAMLGLLMAHPDEVVTRAQLYRTAWGHDNWDRTSNAMNVHIGHMRRKLKRAGLKNPVLVTVKERGFSLRRLNEPELVLDEDAEMGVTTRARFQ